MTQTMPDHFRLTDPPVRNRRRYVEHQLRNGVFSTEQALPPTTTLGARLRTLRTSAGHNQGGMAALIGYGPRNGGRVSDYERGHILPTLPILHRYAQAFNITVSELLDGVL